jgi:hypothetical protein
MKSEDIVPRILTSALDASEWSASHRVAVIPSGQQFGRAPEPVWTSCTCRESHSVAQPVATHRAD